ncbi:MAG TPA: chromate transporter [Stellaceae bacterium]|nr:chromate transporter [Stellaceae bacterium]
MVERDLRETAPTPPLVSLGMLFGAFLRITLSGFGGTLPWAHRILVDERRWLSPREFVDALSLCQFLPGPNVVNLSIVVGQRFRGVAGALAAFSGLVGAPFLIVLGLGVIYSRYGHAPVIDRALAGVSASAAGLVWAMGLKMAQHFQRVPRAVIVTLLGFFAVGVMQWPILPVILVLTPLSVAAAWVRR